MSKFMSESMSESDVGRPKPRLYCPRPFNPDWNWILSAPINWKNEFAENNVYAESNFGCSTFSPSKGTVPKNFNERSYNENTILPSESESPGLGLNFLTEPKFLRHAINARKQWKLVRCHQSLKRYSVSFLFRILWGRNFWKEISNYKIRFDHNFSLDVQNIVHTPKMLQT